MNIYQTQIEIVDQFLGQSARVTQPNYVGEIKIKIALPALRSTTILIEVNNVRVEVHQLNSSICAQTVRTFSSRLPAEEREGISATVSAILEQITNILQTGDTSQIGLSIKVQHELLARNIVNRLPVSDEDYRKAAKDLGISFEDMKALAFAVGKQEGKSTPFVNDFPRILYERHLMYRHISNKSGEEIAISSMEANPELVNKKPYHKRNKKNPDPQNEYGPESNQRSRLENATTIDADSARQSASYGLYQVLGENYPERYQSSLEMERAMDSNLEQFLYFLAHLKKRTGAVEAIKSHNWEKLAAAYNGKRWRKINPDYANNIGKYFNCAVDPKNNSPQAVNRCINPATKSNTHGKNLPKR